MTATTLGKDSLRPGEEEDDDDDAAQEKARQRDDHVMLSLVSL